jgi:hypothetical protein
MTLLGQQELLTPAPQRRLIVAPGCDAHWGVDTSVARVAIAWVHGGRRDVVTLSLPKREGGERLAYAFEVLRDEVRDLLLTSDDLPAPGLVFVEQPSGKQPNLPLTYMVGIVQGAIYAGVVLAGAPGPRVETCTSSWWKKRACGRGNIYKPKLTDTREYGVLAWARQNGYVGSSWDEADAWGIAEAARREVLLEVR